MKFHISRWRYWWGYVVVFLLVMLAIWFTDRAADAPAWIIGSLAVVLFIVLEIVIRLERIVVGDSEIELRKGILSKSIIRISLNKVSNVSISQSVLQRILRYGDVEIDTPGGPTAEIVLKGFEEAGKIERLVSERIHKVHEAHEHHKGVHAGP